MSETMKFQAGDRPPYFGARTDVNPDFAFGSVAGRWIVLLFFGSLADPAGRAAHEAVLARRAVFDDVDLAYFGVSADPEDRTVRGLKATPPGLRYFYDDDRAVASLYGVAEADGAISPTAVLLDRALRIAVIEPAERISALLDQAEAMIAAERGNPVQQLAPVLTAPRVFEPELCQRLIDYYLETGGKASGVMREVNGMTVGMLDDRMKRRRDVIIQDAELIDLTRERISRRLIPEIFRAYQWRATRIERFMVACYDEADQGFFNAHRDNTTAGTAHRRFAVTLNLNDGYDGGALRFPEFGATLYKPPLGGATVFNCSLLHAATPVTRGTRYVFVPFLYDESGAQIRQANLGKLAGRENPGAAALEGRPPAEAQAAE